MFIKSLLFIYLYILAFPAKEVQKFECQNYLNRVRYSKNCEFLQSFHHRFVRHFSPTFYKIKYDALCRICVKVCIYSIVNQSKIFDFYESLCIMENVLPNAQLMVSLFCPNFDRTNVKRKLESDALLGVHVIRLWLILYR